MPTAPPLEDQLRMVLSPLQRAVLRIVRSAGREGITTEALMERIYGGREWPSSNVVTIHVLRTNARIEPLGWRIETRPRRGRDARRYLTRLVP